MNLLAILEGLLFVVGDEGLSLEQAETVLEVDREKLAGLIDALQQEYNKDTHGIKIEVLGNYLKLVTKKEHKEYYQKLIEEDNNTLSEAALESLAIIAYNEPITRVKVDEIRGVSSAHIVRRLVAKGLIKELGRSELPGRPMLYGTTSNFLDYFGLASISELPKMVEIEDIDEEVDLFESKYKEF